MNYILWFDTPVAAKAEDIGSWIIAVSEERAKFTYDALKELHNG